MAQGTVVAFDQWMVDVAEALMNHETGTFNIALVNNTSVPTITTAIPHWGGTGTTDLSTNEATPTGGTEYPAGGHALANASVTLVGGDADIDFDDKSTYTQDAGSPTDAFYAVIYNTTAAAHCFVFIELGGVFNMTTGDLTITFGVPLVALDNT